MVHPTAVVHPGARLHETVEVGPYAVIGDGVEIGPHTVIGPHVVIQGPAVIGARNRIAAGVCLGGDPQDVGYRGENTWLRIGDDNVIREHVTIHRGTPKGRGETVIGNGNYIMTHVHVGHDCRIGDRIVLTHGVGLSGFVEIEDRAIVGGMTGLHQFVRVGTMAMVGGCSYVHKDVPPFMLVSGNPARVWGPNTVGLRRNGLDSATRLRLKAAFRRLYRSGLNISQALESLEQEMDDPHIAHLIRFIRGSRRGVLDGAAGRRHEEEGEA